MKGKLKKVGKFAMDMEKRALGPDGQREIDLGVPGITAKASVKKHRTGVYSAKTKFINWYVLIPVLIILVVGVVLTFI